MRNLEIVPVRALASIVYGNGQRASAGETFTPVSAAERLEVLGLTRPGAVPVAEELDGLRKSPTSAVALSREEIGKILGISASPIFGAVDPSNNAKPEETLPGIDLRLGEAPAQMPQRLRPEPHNSMLRVALRERGQKPDFNPA